ncbi:MAG: energy transducer TonB [Thiotrichales bacterium]
MAGDLTATRARPRARLWPLVILSFGCHLTVALSLSHWTRSPEIPPPPRLMIDLVTAATTAPLAAPPAPVAPAPPPERAVAPPPKQRPKAERAKPVPTPASAAPISPPAEAAAPQPPAPITEIAATTPPAASPPQPPPTLELQPARYRHNPAPAYPERARRLGLEGDLILQAEVHPDGTPGEIRIHRASGNALLDRAARDAVRTWRFEPARRGTEPVASWVEIPVRFRLND